jgi:hypothetical protein
LATTPAQAINAKYARQLERRLKVEDQWTDSDAGTKGLIVSE